MTTNYGDYIAWDKGYGYQISKITKVMNLNRHTHLNKDEIIFIDNNSYVMNEIEQLVDEGKAALFYEEDVIHVTENIDDVNNVLLLDKSIYEVYGEWVGLLMAMSNKSVEAVRDDIGYCKETDLLASNLAGIEEGYYKEKEIYGNGYAELFVKYWKSHLGL